MRLLELLAQDNAKRCERENRGRDASVPGGHALAGMVRCLLPVLPGCLRDVLPSCWLAGRCRPAVAAVYLVDRRSIGAFSAGDLDHIIPANGFGFVLALCVCVLAYRPRLLGCDWGFCYFSVNP